MLISFTFYYLFALYLAVITTITLSIFLSISNNNPFSSTLILTKTGACYLSNDEKSYQLLADSRLSFIGCWLIMLPTPTLPAQLTTQDNQIDKVRPKKLFIFRDAITAKDFSRITNVIKQLE